MKRTIYVSKPGILYQVSEEPEMGLPAFREQFDGLAAAVRATPVRAPEIARVLTLSRARIVKPVNEVVDRIQALGVSLRNAKVDIPACYDNITQKNVKELQETIAAAASLLDSLSTSVLEDRSGANIAVSLEQLAKSWASRSRDDGRLAHQLVRKLRSTGTVADQERLQFRATFLTLIERMGADLDACEREEAASANRHAHDELFLRSISHYPQITAYLAR